MSKAPFDIDLAIQRIQKAVQPFPKAAMFELFDEGFTSAFEQLVACIISIRTYDEVMLPTARKLFALARTPQASAGSAWTRSKPSSAPARSTKTRPDNCMSSLNAWWMNMMARCPASGRCCFPCPAWGPSAPTWCWDWPAASRSSASTSTSTA